MKSTDFLNMPTDSIRAALERLLQVVKPEYNETDEIIAVVQAIAAARADLAAEPPDPAGGGEALLAAAAAPLVREDKSGCARLELVTAIYCLASHFEIACSDLSGDDLQKARNDIAYARCIAAKHNQNGPGCPQFPPAYWGRPPANGESVPPAMLTEEELASSWNHQADEFNRWDSLDSGEHLAWAQARAVARDRAARLPDPAAGGEALLAAAPLEGEDNAWERAKERAWDMYKIVGYQGEQALDDRGFDRAADLIRDEITLIRRVPAPAAEGEDPTTEELNRLYREIYGLHSDVLGPMPRKFARAVLARWGRPAATLLQQQAAELAALRAGVMPVAVSERPWEREGWCDKQGRCWFLSSRFLTWSLASPPVAITCQIARLHSLPFHAIPLPVPQGGEVE